MPDDQGSSLLALPRPGRNRILVIFGRHPAVEGEPQPATHWPGNAAAPSTFRPRDQSVLTCTRVAE
jgi:hypothetical protein